MPVQLAATARSSDHRPGGHRERIARERAGLIDGPCRRDECPSMSARPPYAPTGSPPPMIFPETGQIRLRRRKTCCAPPGPSAEPGNHLVEDQKRCPARSQSSRRPSQEAGARRHQRPCCRRSARRRSPRSSRPVRINRRSTGVEIVVTGDQRVRGGAPRVTPGLVGTPSVIAPDPACTRKRQRGRDSSPRT